MSVGEKREYGSEFWNVPLADTETEFAFARSTQWYLSGRHALSAVLDTILATRKIRQAAVPSWCCDSMIHPFVKRGIRIRFYPVTVGADGLLQDLSSFEDCDLLLVMDYFGWRNSVVPSGYRGIVVRDLTHGFLLPKQDDADYYFGSLRKWCGFWTGGFAFARKTTPVPIRTDGTNEPYCALRRQAMQEKEAYLSGSSGEKSYLKIFREAEDMLDACEQVFAASERDVILSGQLDTRLIRKKRRENAAVLYDRLADSVSFVFPKLTEDAVPLFVPILSEHRDALRAFLIERQIYCPVHWPVSAYHRLTSETEAVYRDSLSLVCDQRYDADDMDYICTRIREGLSQC